MAFDSNPYQNSDIKKLSDDLINNINTQSILPGSVTSYTYRVTNSGSILGAITMSVYNSGEANGIFQGVAIKPGETVPVPAVLNSQYAAISYDASGTEFLMQVTKVS